MPDTQATEARFAALVEALMGRDGVTLGSGRRGFGSGALQVKGSIFATVSHGRRVVKLPQERVAALLASGDGLAFDAGKGRPMQEWVALAERAEGQWLTLAQEARTFVAGRTPLEPDQPAGGAAPGPTGRAPGASTEPGRRAGGNRR